MSAGLSRGPQDLTRVSSIPRVPLGPPEMRGKGHEPLSPGAADTDFTGGTSGGLVFPPPERVFHSLL